MAAEGKSLTALTVDLLIAFVSNNEVSAAKLPALIQSTHAALAALGSKEEKSRKERMPAVTVQESLASPSHILSMIDGKPYRSLKKHVAAHGMTFEEYKERYQLPHDYPAVCAAYSETRRDIAQKLGLGTEIKGPLQSAAASRKPQRGRRTRAEE